MIHIQKYLKKLAKPDLQNNATKLTVKPTADNWGWFPSLSLTSALGILLVALAYNGGRFVIPGAEILYWFGLLVLFLPIALRILSTQPSRRERIALLLLLGSTLYSFRYLAYPLSFAYHDEFLQWRSTNDLLTYGHLFHPNSLLPISPFYPGLQIVMSALSSLTGFPIFELTIIVLGVVEVVFVLALYLFYEHLSHSQRIASIATLLYMANLEMSGITQFIYQGLALPLAMFVVFAVAHRCYTSGRSYWVLTLVIWLGIAAVVITHHITSYALVTFLLLWTAVFLFLKTLTAFCQNHNQKIQANPGGAALLGLVLCVIWLIYTGERAIAYLYPPLETTIQQFIQILTTEKAPRQLFYDNSGFAEPQWERITAFTSVALVLLGLPFGLFNIWRYHRTNAATFALAIGALTYPASQILRLTQDGETIGGRAPAFLFLAVGFVLAIGIAEFWLPHISSKRRFAVITGMVTLIFMGGWVIGTAPLWNRLPGPYLVAAQQRSIQPESVTAGEWTRSYLGPGQRIAVDEINSLIMATYGDQWIVTPQSDKIDVTPVFTSLQFGDDDKAILQSAEIQYLVVDLRLSTSLPRKGFYFYEPESNTNWSKPISPVALTKFDGVKNVNRVFDSGNIIIYDVRAITSG